MTRTRVLEIVSEAAALRHASRAYADPVDEIWLGTARRLGLRVVRSAEAYAAYDGRGTLTIGTQETLDADDSLAQLIFHELCHALIAGSAAERALDWGFGDDERRDLLGEHACQRLQAHLAQAHGLRSFFAPTTEHRAYYDALPDLPLAVRDDPAASLAHEAWRRARGGAWLVAIDAALQATAAIARATAPFADDASLWRAADAMHASGFPVHADATRRCETCAWLFRAGPGRPVARCRQTRRGPRSVARRVEPADRACSRWEPRLDEASCGTCGACCHAGYDIVPVGPRETLARRHPELLERGAFGPFLPRPGGSCVALQGTGEPGVPYRCRVYADRPRACADLARGGDGCLAARRRVGLSA